MVVALTLIGASAGIFARAALAQTPTASSEPPLERFAVCGASEPYDHRILITKTGTLYGKDAGTGHMDAVFPTTWAICNATEDPLSIRFARVQCQNTPVSTCPADFTRPNPMDECGALGETSGGIAWIPPSQWGYVTGSANSARDECEDPLDSSLDTYTFGVDVQLVSANGSPEGPTQSLDPQLQIDRGDRLSDLVKRFWVWLLLLVGGGMLAGFVLARWLRAR
jgi:hypothetical protein